MKRRSKAGGEPFQGRRQKAAKPTLRNAPNAVTRSNSPPIQEETEVARLTRELREAREQHAATADVLKVISRSAFNLQIVLDTLVQSAAGLCEADTASLVRPQGSVFQQLASYGYSQELNKFMETHPVYLGRGTITGRTVLEGKAIQIPDVLADAEFTFTESVKIGGMRTMLGVPLLRDGVPIGVIMLSRRTVRPFSDKQVELVKTFADQAVIAIENNRLLNDLRQSLEQQTATSEVLQVISSSPSDLEPVFQAMLENATRICEAKFGVLYRYDEAGFEPAALSNAPPAYANFVWSRGQFFPQTGNGLDRLLHTKAVIHTVDEAAEPVPTNSAKLAGARSQVLVPMLKEGKLAGAIAIYRQEVRPFTDRQIELVKNFAAQAVIAIENARLLNELRQSLEQQTATADVLKVISSSPGSLEPVFKALLENATKLCDASHGALWLCEAGGLRTVALHGAFPELYLKLRRDGTVVRFNSSIPGVRAIQSRQPTQVDDLREDQAYLSGDSVLGAAVKVGGIRTLLAVPMFQDDKPVGNITIYRQEVRPFTDEQVTLVQNFAAQAVIAIENARLLNDLRQRTTDLTEALEQQTATSEVLQVISSSPGELEPIFAAMLEKAVRICGANFGNIYRWDGDTAHLVAAQNTPPAFAEYRRRFPHHQPNPKLGIGRMFATKETLHVTDARAAPAYIEQRDPSAVAAVELGGVRSYIAVPMLKESELIGGFTLCRQEVRPFTDKQIALVTNFAAQAVIAIENARLLSELRQRTDDLSHRTTDLTEALEQQTATSEVLTVISSFPGDLQPVFDAMLANATRLCEATHGHVWTFDGEQMHAVAVRGDAQFVKWLRDHNPVRPIIGSAAERIVQGERFVHVADRRREPAYRNDQTFRGLVDASGIRASLSVALRKGETLLGMINVYRQEVRPFTDKQIELVENFAAQAVIAIENARLLNELRERTEQLQAQSKELADLNQQLGQRVTDQIGEIERMGRLRRFLPPQVADLIVASGTEKQLESHRREITALFCDLRGFTGFSESADPEDVMTVLREYHEALGASIIRYSGTLERYAGDGVMVVFNDPVPVKNPALQAVLMALEMRDAIGALTETWHRWGHDIGFGIGIAHGFATLGTIGFEGRFDYAAIGTVSNVASRLCDEAKPGQILISPRVLTKVENAVKVEPVGEFELKGIRRPLAAYNVLATNPAN